MAPDPRRVLGIDEAGRGPVLGPLVMAGAVLHEDALDSLEALGVDDSKQLSPRTREALDVSLREHLVSFEVLVFEPSTVDEYRRRNHLDVLEAEGASQLIRRLAPDVAYVDGLGPGGRKHRERILERLEDTGVELVVENGADGRYPIVGAASILAKVARDAVLTTLAEVHGRLGSGYPHDPHTRAFLTRWLDEGKPWPDFVRTSWATISKLEAERRQGKLF